MYFKLIPLGFALLVSLFVFLSVHWAHANVVGSDLQSFNPTSDGLDFVTVQSARTLPGGRIVIGGFYDHAKNTLPDALFSTSANADKFGVTNTMSSTDFHLGLGLTRFWDVGFSLSSLAGGSVQNSELKTYFEKRGLTDARVNTKLRFLDFDASGLAFVLSANFPQISNDPFLGGQTKSMYEAELAWGGAFDRWMWAFNGGYRFRSPGPLVAANSPYEPVGGQLLASMAMARHFGESKWTGIGEIYASKPVKNTLNYTTDQLTSVETLLGIKYLATKSLDLHGGVTFGLSQGVSSPDYRVYAGLNWSPFSIWGNEPPANQARRATASNDGYVTSRASDLSVFDRDPREGIEKFRVIEINFDTASDVVPDSFLPYLKRFAEYVNKGKPIKRLTISGHTDSVGGVAYNEGLSQRRADSVKRVLAEKFGLPADKMETIGFGKRYPAESNETAVGRSMNRRVEFELEREDVAGK